MKDEIYKGRLFEERERLISGFPKFLASARTPFTIELQAEWGQGKSTFLSRLKNVLIDQGFGVITYNAWENDFEADPLQSIINEIVPQLLELARPNYEDIEDDKLISVYANLISVVDLIQNLDIPFLSTIAKTAIGLKDFTQASTNIKKELKTKKKESFKTAFVNQITESTASCVRQNFQKSLSALTGLLPAQMQQKPIVLLIDELDRCNPDYAVRLLERIKHLFSVDGYVFIFASSRNPLRQIIKHYYNFENDEQIDSYLLRFFDISFFLPMPNFPDFIAFKIADSKLPDKLKFGLNYLKPITFKGVTLRKLEKVIFLIESLFMQISYLLDNHNLNFWLFMIVIGVLAYNFDFEFYQSFFVNGNFTTNSGMINGMVGIPFVRSLNFSQWPNIELTSGSPRLIDYPYPKSFAFGSNHYLDEQTIKAFRLFFPPNEDGDKVKNSFLQFDKLEKSMIFFGKIQINSLEQCELNCVAYTDAHRSPTVSRVNKLYSTSFSRIRQQVHKLIETAEEELP